MYFLQSYYDAMDPENNTSIPLRLRDKRHVVFGNLPEIHKFHETLVVVSCRYIACSTNSVILYNSVYLVWHWKNMKTILKKWESAS